MKTELKSVVVSLMCLVAILSSTACAAQKAVDLSKWELVWQDEFASEELDDAKWTRCKRGTPDWKNTMSDDPRLLKIDDGILHLRGIANDHKDEDPAPYLTAGVTSRGKFAFQYGKVQIRARFKCAQGAWPALWMLGAERGWPANGEIDLMEHLNFDHKVYQTVHSEYTIKIDKTNTPKKSGTAPIKRDDWNTYGCEWDANTIVFTVNGKPTHTYPRVPEKGEKQWPFNQPFYFILSMQIGGNWVNGSGPTNPDHYPAGMEIDWIRVYKPNKPSARAASTRPRSMTEDELLAHIDKGIQTLPSRDNWNTASKQFVQTLWQDFKQCHLNPSRETTFGSIGMSGKIPEIKSYDSYLGTYRIHYPLQSTGNPQFLRIYKKDKRFFADMQGLKLPAIGRNKCIFFTSGQVVFSDIPTMETGAYCRLVIHLITYDDGKYFMSEVGMPCSAWDSIQKLPDNM